MKRKLVPLPEDDYVEGLAAVIQRDYYPELNDLRDQQEWMAAEREEDFGKKQQIEMRKRQREAAAQLVAQGGGAAGTDSVDNFLSTYTSEDNLSFKQLQEEELAERRDNDTWGKMRAALMDKEREKKMLLLEGGSSSGLAAIEAAPKVLALEGADKQLQVYEDQLAKSLAAAQVKVIDRDNTRLSADAVRRLNTVAQPVDAEGKRKKLSALVRRNRFLSGPGKQTATIDLDDFLDAPAREEDVLSEPTVNGCTFVSTPQIVPGAGGESPLVSWGTVQGTPVVLQHGKQFTIPDEPARDRVAQKLTDKKRTPAVASGRSSSRAKTPLASPVFSPAGQKLLEARMRSKGGSTPFSFKSPSLTPNTTAGKGSRAQTPRFQSPVVVKKK